MNTIYLLVVYAETHHDIVYLNLLFRYLNFRYMLKPFMYNIEELHSFFFYSSSSYYFFF